MRKTTGSVGFSVIERERSLRTLRPGRPPARAVPGRSPAALDRAVGMAPGERLHAGLAPERSAS